MLKKWMTFGMVALAGFAASCFASVGQVNFEAGYQRSQLTFNERLEESPHLFSKEKFKDLDIFQIGLNARVALGYNFYMRADGYWGWILDGTFQKTVGIGNGDYSSNFSGGGWEALARRQNLVDDRYVYGVSAAIGYPFFFCNCSTMLAPVIGYAIDAQSIACKQRQIANYDYSACCDNDYRAHYNWYGPFVGLDLEYRGINECWDFYANVEYHWGTCNTKRHAFEGFSSRKLRNNHVRAWECTVGADYNLDSCWTVGVYLTFTDWSGHKHHKYHGCNSAAATTEITEAATSESSSNSSSRGDSKVKGRNTAKWRSYAINLSVGREF